MIIFDMAGTAVDEDNLVYKTIQSVMIDHGHRVDLDLVLLIGAGKDKWQAIHDILHELTGGEPSSDEINNLYQDFQEKLDFTYQVAPMKLFDDVADIIPVLRNNNIRVVFNTGYTRPVAEKILARINCRLETDIDGLVTSSDVLRGRPAPDMIWKACDQFGIKPNETVKIGDSGIDIEEGRNAGVRYCIGVTTGAQKRATLAEVNPDFIFDSARELLDILSIGERR